MTDAKASAQQNGGTHGLGDGPHGQQESSTSDMSCLQKCSNTITGGLENGFERIGLSVGTYPWRFILGTFLVSAVCALGLIAFTEVTDSDKLWVPTDAQVLKDKSWIEDNYGSTVWREQIIAVSGNILTPTGIAALLDIYQSSLTISSPGGITLSDVCIKAGSACIVSSVLEIWSYDNATIRSLTQSKILSDVNSVTVSPVTFQTIDITTYLGTRTTDPSSGNITAAEAAIMTWFTEGNETMEDTTQAWESEFINLGLEGHSDLSETYVFSQRSWRDESGKAISSDVTLLSIGYFLVIIFVVLVLGKFNLMEQKAWLTLGGFICIGLAILISIGLASAFQQGYGPLQSILPFLLLGLGVDDMFVIMSSLLNLTPEEQNYEIPQKVATVLRHAGVSITVTSLTDFVAFMIGATTIIPALQSFCIYAGIGIISLYLLQAMFFTACLTLDLRRAQANRDACCCMIKHESPYTPNACSQKLFVPFVFKKGLAKIITKLPFKIAVIIITLSLFGLNIWGLIKLELYFDPNWFLPQDGYAYAFTAADDRYFPDAGSNGYVYCVNLNYWSHQTEFETLDSSMTSSQWISNGTTDSWFTALTGWLSIETDASITSQLDANSYPVSENVFINLTFLLTTVNQTRTSAYVQFASSSGSDIVASRFPFTHIDMSDASTQILAMDSMRGLVSSAGFSTTECFPYSRSYLSWETNKVIKEELFRNLGLALICVFLVTLILIANLWTSFLVFCGVLLTVVDVAGSMYLWGLTIDTVTSIILILAVGLAVDYSAHIGHMFMTISGTRHARVKGTISEMGPPVFYGGFSTFLAFILLSRSNSYVFTTFFKLNFLVVLYGLFHGLIFLPVLLSWLGPDPYPTASGVYQNHHPSAETAEGVHNQAFTAHKLNPGENGHPLSSIKSSMVAPDTSKEVTNVNNTSFPPPASHAPQTNSSPPPDYSPPIVNKQFLPSVQT